MGVVHAIALGLCVLFTELACARERERGVDGPNLLRIVAAIVLATFIGFFIAAFGVHSCDEGQPLQQWLIPAVCIGFAIAIIRNRRRMLTLVAALAITSFVLTMSYAGGVHDDTWIGRPTPSWSMEETHPGRVPEECWHTPLTGLYRR
jgi:hypothetical protein